MDNYKKILKFTDDEIKKCEMKIKIAENDIKRVLGDIDQYEVHDFKKEIKALKQKQEENENIIFAYNEV